MADFTQKQAEEEFEKYARNVSEDDVSGVLEKEKDITGKAHGPLEKFAQEIKLFFSIIKDYVNGTYKELPWTTIAGTLGSLLYVFSPIDLVPDIIPIAGLADDAVVFGICLAGINNDLQKYKLWKEQNTVKYKIIKDPPSE
jgi:uncharacterized membrane protein YkvA (DUF1232 family)